MSTPYRRQINLRPNPNVAMTIVTRFDGPTHSRNDRTPNPVSEGGNTVSQEEAT
jgi:hypothetical protein